MKSEKKYTESFFDELFKEKEIIDYELVDKKMMGRRDRLIIKILENYGVNGKRCLDIGPGTGRWLKYCKTGGACYLGAIDLSEESINRYRNMCDAVQKADVEIDSFNFENSFFDVTLSFMVLEHLRDPQKYLSEIFRVTKTGGLILMTIPNIVSFRSRLRVLFGYLPHAVSSDRTHIKFYTRRELKALFKKFNAFVEMIPTTFTPHPFNSKKIRIPSIRLTQSLDDHLLFRVRRISL
jgi:ubiquinone/menaquinone biosynthesis C-methylase UbiE